MKTAEQRKNLQQVNCKQIVKFGIAKVKRLIIDATPNLFDFLSHHDDTSLFLVAANSCRFKLLVRIFFANA